MLIQLPRKNGFAHVFYSTYVNRTKYFAAFLQKQNKTSFQNVSRTVRTGACVKIFLVGLKRFHSCHPQKIPFSTKKNLVPSATEQMLLRIQKSFFKMGKTSTLLLLILKCNKISQEWL
jgi:hypothetical protein